MKPMNVSNNFKYNVPLSFSITIIYVQMKRHTYVLQIYKEKSDHTKLYYILND